MEKIKKNKNLVKDSKISNGRDLTIGDKIVNINIHLGKYFIIPFILLLLTGILYFSSLSHFFENSKNDTSIRVDTQGVTPTANIDSPIIISNNDPNQSTSLNQDLIEGNTLVTKNLIPKTSSTGKLEGKPEGSTKEETSFIKEVQKNMVYIPSGSFFIDINENNHLSSKEIRVSNYYIGKFEVTQELWRSVMEADPPNLLFKDCNQCPVENVTWEEVQKFIKKLNSLTGERYRLPTEAEWLYAAYGSKNLSNNNFHQQIDMESISWYNKNANNRVHPVGLKKANTNGIFDMWGNIAEMTVNCWQNTIAENVDTNKNCKQRVLLGGSWSDRPKSLLNRTPYYGNIPNSAKGFRLVK